MNNTPSIRHCLHEAARECCDRLPGYPEALDRFDEAIREAYSAGADTVQVPIKDKHDTDVVFFLGKSIANYGARTTDGRVHMGDDFVKLLAATARSMKDGKPFDESDAEVFIEFNLATIRAAQPVPSATPASALDGQRRRMRP